MLYTIVGKKRSGKDTVSSFIADETNAIMYALAEPIKKALYQGLYFNVRKKYGGSAFTFEDVNGETDYDRESVIDIPDRIAYMVMKDSLSYLKNIHISFTKYENTYALALVSYFDKKENLDKPWSIRRFMQTLGTDVCVNVDTMIWMRIAIDKYLSASIIGRDFIVTDCRQDHEINTLRKLNSKIVHVCRPDLVFSKIDGHITEKGLPVLGKDIVIINDGTLSDLKYKVFKELEL